MSIVTNAKELADVIKKLGDVELYRKIVELEGEIIELTREKHALETRVQELTETLAVNENLQFKEPFYYANDDAVPYCPNCWEANHTAIHLINGGLYREGTKTRFDCPSCKHLYWYKGRHT